MRLSNLFLFLAGFLLLTPAMVCAQGEYIWGGNSGWQLGTGVSGSQEVTNYYGALGTSIKGIADVALYYGRQDHSGYQDGVGGVQFSVWILKEGRRGNPLSIGLSGSIEGPDSESYRTASVGLAKRIYFADSKAFLLPLAALNFYWGLPENFTYGGTLGLSLAIPLATKSAIVFSVSNSIVDDVNSTSGMVSFVIGRIGKE